MQAVKLNRMIVKIGFITKMVYLEQVGHALLKQGRGQVLGVGMSCFETTFEHDQENWTEADAAPRLGVGVRCF